MKKIPIYQVDAFAGQLFSGNPAAVIITDSWLDDNLMQKISSENNLAETAFVLRNKNYFEIRWFTPAVEVDLCGHATLASAFVIFDILKWKEDKITFKTRSRGDLIVEKQDDILVLDFPADKYKESKAPDILIKGIGQKPLESYKGMSDFLLIYKSQKDIELINPDFALLSKTKGRGIIVSAPGDEVDFVSRFFAPSCGINEDPVTGSAHTTLIPYWSKRLNKNKLIGKQISQRTGILQCENCGTRVKIGGRAMLYMTGEIYLNE